MAVDINTAIHDIRNPLNTIAMNAELARLIIETNADPLKAINAIDAILRSCKLCSDRLQDLKKAVEHTHLTLSERDARKE